jgi:hypothetical protein
MAFNPRELLLWGWTGTMLPANEDHVSALSLYILKTQLKKTYTMQEIS